MPESSTPTLKLSDLARIQVGQSFRKSVLEDPDSPYFVLQTRDLLSGGRISSNLMRMSALNEKPKPNVDPGDVLVLSRGVRFNAGVVCELPGPTTAQNILSSSNPVRASWRSFSPVFSTLVQLRIFSNPWPRERLSST
jgi:hypothetical protein